MVTYDFGGHLSSSGSGTASASASNGDEECSRDLGVCSHEKQYAPPRSDLFSSLPPYGKSSTHEYAFVFLLVLSGHMASKRHFQTFYLVWFL
jgi:hypothetical protein